MRKKSTAKSTVSQLDPRDGMWDYDGDETPAGDTYSVGLFVWEKRRGKLVRGKVRYRLRGFREDKDYLLLMAASMASSPAAAKNVNLTMRSQRAS